MRSTAGSRQYGSTKDARGATGRRAARVLAMAVVAALSGALLPGAAFAVGAGVRAASAPTPRTSDRGGAGRTGAARKEREAPTAAVIGRRPLRFEPSQGLSDPRVRFVARGPGYRVLLTDAEAVLDLRADAPHGDVAAGAHRLPGTIAGGAPESTTGREPQARASGAAGPRSEPDRPPPAAFAQLRMRLVGGNPRPRVQGLDPGADTASYFLGADARLWRPGVRTFGKAEYEQVYAGIDLVYYGNERELEYDFTVAPGADPRRIRLRLEGARDLRVDGRGDLVLQTPAGEVRFRAPFVYQEDGGSRREIGGGYVIAGRREVGFRVGAYDRTRPLVIDPTLAYAATLGGAFNDQASGVAADAAGNAYVVGTTFSLDFPVAGGFQPTLVGGLDAVVSKVSPAGALLYSTYLGGSSDDLGLAIAVDATGAAYVTGSTRSTNFPTASPVQGSNAGGFTDVFVAKISPSGSALTYSTYVGGTDQEAGTGIAVDGLGSAYVTGYTQSGTFPTTVGAFQTAPGGGTCFGSRPCADAFVVKLSPSGNAYQYATLLGGSGNDNLDVAAAPYGAIAVDASGNAHVTGVTSSLDFPTAGPFQAACTTCSTYSPDAFVTKLNGAGAALIFSSYLGGSDSDLGLAIAVDSSGAAFVSGVAGFDFPTTPGALQTAWGGGLESFVTKVSPDGSSLPYSTYLGGSAGDDRANGIAVDPDGNAYVTGTTDSPDFPTDDALQERGGGGLFRTTDGASSWSVVNAGLRAGTAAIAVDPTNPGVVYAANDLGVAKSADAGASWNPTGLYNLFSAYAVEVDPADATIVYAGVFDGVAKSGDGGATWSTSRSGLAGVNFVHAVAIDPTAPSVVYAATSSGGIRKSTDGGASWSAMNTGITDLKMNALLLDETAPMTLYAGNGTGVLKSSDGGATWTNSSTGLPAGNGRVVTGLAFDPTATSTLYATTATVGIVQGGVFESTNAGGNWTALLRTDFSMGSIVVDPGDSSTFYAASNAPTHLGLSNPSSGVGVLKSADGGATWTPSGLTQVFVQELTVDPTNPSTIYAATDGGDDAFVAVLEATGSTLGSSTYLGGTGAEQGKAIAIAGAGALTNAVIAGATASLDFPSQVGTPPPSTAPLGPRAPDSSPASPEKDTIPRRQPFEEFLAGLEAMFPCPELFLVGHFAFGTQGKPYDEFLLVGGGYKVSDFEWSVEGDLPPGLGISYRNASIHVSGVPTAAGQYDITITLRHKATSCTVRQVYGIHIDTAPEPEIAVRSGGAPLTNGQTTPVDLGTSTLGGTCREQAFEVCNEGDAALEGLDVLLSPGCEVVDELATSLEADTCDSLTMALDCTESGGRMCEVGIASNDSDENPFTFPISGVVAAAPPLRYDFGTSDSPVQAGYRGVGPTSSYSQAVGFGWLAGAIGSLDRGVGDLLTRDLNWTEQGTFVVTVPNGTYDVTVTCGDASAAHDQMGIFLEDDLVDTVTTTAGEFPTKTFRVTVADAQLTLALDDLGGSDAHAVINALTVRRVDLRPRRRLP